MFTPFIIIRIVGYKLISKAISLHSFLGPELHMDCISQSPSMKKNLRIFVILDKLFSLPVLILYYYCQLKQ